MISVDDFSRLVSAIYASAVTPEQWDPTLVELVRAFDGAGAGLLTSAPATRQSDVMVRQVGADPSARTTYNEYYGRLDYVATAVENAPVGRIHTGTELILPNVHTEFYADWCRPNHFQDGLFVRLAGGTPSAWLGVAAPRGPEPFGTTDRLTLMRQLVPHLKQAIHTRMELATLAQREHELARAIDQFQHGIVVIGPDYRILHLNTAAETILVSCDGLQLRPHGSIAATLSRADRELRRLVCLALDTQEDRVPEGGSFACPRPSGRRGYAVHVVPLSPDTDGLSHSTVTALVLIVDPEREPEPDTAVLRRLYSLTDTEAEVAMRVARGEGLKPVADELSVSMTTIRTHLQHVFDKTDTHRQAELVRVLLAIGPSFHDASQD
ncbi:helix-turn-helix transcriptional regulator [Rhodococcus tukisamuensis]|uniref:DNA-binding transcriptional regulator, CsgD family n=1 Tax=Rhodococcus tukisamuensis TaxID=168276 RepID=A0A1G7CAX5_9NOCA|nr:helix-turn-helix transcriptional regulator [Rhodococcus tukisamuensis]SDE35870.1 DNA-binding transcriptional regulator, CsgD family [Rhodococcus tukisamuensis]